MDWEWAQGITFYRLDFDDKAELTRTVNRYTPKGLIFVYVLEAAVAIALVLVYYFVALPGF